MIKIIPISKQNLATGLEKIHILGIDWYNELIVQHIPHLQYTKQKLYSCAIILIYFN